LGLIGRSDEPARIWIETGRSILDSSYYYQAKYMRGNTGWALRGSKEVQDTIFSLVIDQITDVKFNPSYKTLSVLRLWGYPLSFGYADVGVGVGYAKGERSLDCSAITGIIAAIDQCEVKNFSAPGLSAQASFVFGRYAGLGGSVSGFYSKEDSRALLSVVLAFGTFSDHGSRSGALNLGRK